MHNTNATSSDIYWACELLTTVGVTADDSDYLTTEPTLTLPLTDNQQLTACFEPLTDEERQQQGMTPLRINEISAANYMSVNEYWKRNDWVELYNTTDADIDVEGMYLSDNVKKPQKYQITKGDGTAQTVVPAHGYLTIWCDKLEPLTQLHASFKLSDDGGDVLLTAEDGSWTDRLAYPAHEGDQSVGRYPDGSQQVYLLTMPTIGKANLMTSYSTVVDEAEMQGIRQTTGLMADGSITVRYMMGDLIVRANQTAGDVQLCIYELSGQMAVQQSIDLSSGYAAIPLAGRLGSGCYVARVVTRGGHTSTCKFLINR